MSGLMIRAGNSRSLDPLAAVTVRLLDGFDDPSFTRDEWNALVSQGDTDVVYLTWEWQRAWWNALGRGRLLLIAAERDGQVVAVAPFYADSGMVFFVGSGVAGYMDFIGDVGSAAVLDLLLETARAEAPGFVGFRLYCVQESSRSGNRLQAAATRLGLRCYEEKRWPAPAVDLAGGRADVRAAARGRSLVRLERYFEQRGSLTFRRLTDGDAIARHLETFFEQHISGIVPTAGKSPFLDRRQRALFEELTHTADRTGWPRLSVLDWDGRPIAFEYGLQYHGTYFTGPCSFALDVADRHPDHVLLRRMLLAALDSGAHTYDFGVGDDSYQFVFATKLRHVQTWGLYPADLLPGL